ncbi:hypothetical protein ACFY5D_00125 [Paeniglutamicibacter sp. NPDC012692]|uniref:hypothetical protein n=1 Tax=Paeniglutamicibacter sp. NPDC012692 TaxID=3364388 RepID=UPI00368C0B34
MENSSLPDEWAEDTFWPHTDEKLLGRRTALTLGVAAAAGLLAGCTMRQSSETPAPTAAEPLREIPWKSKLQTLAPIDGSIKTFEDVFVMTSIVQVATLANQAGSPALAVIMTGLNNQLQFMDPIGGFLERVIDLPDRLVARCMAWDPVERSLLIGVNSGHLFSYDYDTAELLDLGRATNNASSLYGLALDSTGRVWGGSYPEGRVWNYTPDTKKFVQFPRFDESTDYVRSLAITSDDTVYVGTGTVAPKVVCFPAASPAHRTTLELPTLPPTGFVRGIQINGDHVLISADTLKTPLIWNHRTKKLSAAVLSISRGRSAESPSGHTNYWVHGSALYSTDSTTGEDTHLGELDVEAPEHIWASPDCVYVLSREGAQVATHRFDLRTKEVTLQSTVKLSGAGIGVHSLLCHTDGKIYIGGFQGQGIASLDPNTGERWQSLDSVAPNQITGMLQWDAKKTYIGSYSSADIIRFDTTRAEEGRNAFKHMERLQTSYGQSRPIGWAMNSRHVFFGTVPDYGKAGGALGIINPNNDSIEAIYNKLVPNHSIIGLAANEKYVYGTTSTRNGYGKPDTGGNAKVFAFDLASRKLAWVRDVPGHRAVMTPALVDDKIVAATIEGVVVLGVSDGGLVAEHSFTGRLDRHFRPGWSNASVRRLGDSYRFVHVADNSIQVLDFQDGTVQRIEGVPGTGTAMAVAPNGRLFVSHEVLGIAEVSTDPNRES